MTRISARKALLACGAAMALTMAATPAMAQQRTFDLPAQPATRSIPEFARQAGIQIIAPGSILRSVRTPTLRGTYDVRAALRVLLANSGLRIVSDEGGTITLGAARETPRSGEAQAGSAAAASESAENEEIVVTGTNIAGQAPVGSNLITLGRRDIDRSGRASVPELLQIIPQNFGATAPDLTGGAGNFVRGTSPNLRGLGTGTTLTLVNGRRFSASGDNGDLADVSSIPISAIDRVEILADGASAIYGSDAIGGVVNIILRRDFEGAETRLRFGSAQGGAEEWLASQLFGHHWSSGNILVGFQYYLRDALPMSARAYVADADKRPFGGSDFRTTQTNPGNIYNAAFQPTFGIPAGQDGRNLTVGQLGPANLGSVSDGAEILPYNQTTSAFLSFGQDLSDNIHFFLDGRYSHRNFSVRTAAATATLVVPRTNAFFFNPNGGTTTFVNYSFIDDLGNIEFVGNVDSWNLSSGVDVRLGGGWKVTTSLLLGGEDTDSVILNNVDSTALSAALADSNPASAFNPFGDGSNTPQATLDRIRRTIPHDTRSGIFEVNSTANGTLFSLPGGDARIAFGVDYRRETLRSSISPSNLARSVTAGFVETVLPLASDRSGRSIFELSAAGRFEHYSDFGDTFNPKLGARFAPSPFLAFRGTWGTSFRAPRLIDIDVAANPQRGAVLTVADPASPTRTSNVLFQLGGNPDLTEEKGRNWTVGVDFTPSFIDRNLAISATYYRIQYSGRVEQPGPSPVTGILQQEALYSTFINRSPTAAEIAALCPTVTTGSCTTTPPTVIADLRLRNLTRLNTDGLDIRVTDQFDIGASTLSLGLNANYVFSYKRRFTPNAPITDFVDTLNNPNHLRLRGNVGWTLGAFSLDAAANFTGAYRDPGLNRPIGSWTTIDAGLTFQPRSGVLNGFELGLRANNLFNERPPFVNSAGGYDPVNATPLGRFISVELRKRW